MLTAEQARALSGPSVEDMLKEIDSLVRGAAQSGRREVVSYRRPYVVWNLRNMIGADTASEVVQKLCALGYTVSQDMDDGKWPPGLRIRW